MKIELRNVKMNPALSEETECFSAHILIDGDFAGTVANRGSGGANEYRFDDPALHGRFEKFCESLPPVKFGPADSAVDLSMDADLYVGHLLEQWSIRNQVSRWCKTNVVFCLKTEHPRGWLKIRGPYSEADAERIRKRYGDKLDYIANERIASGEPL